MPYLWTLGSESPETPFDLGDPLLVPHKKLVGYTPTQDKKIVAAGCGAPGTQTAALKYHKIPYWTRSYELWCSSDAPDFGLEECMETAMAIDAEVAAARKKERSVYLKWQNYNLSAPIVWSVITGIVIPIREELYGMNGEDGGPYWVVRLDLDVIPGSVALYG